MAPASFSVPIFFGLSRLREERQGRITEAGIRRPELTQALTFRNSFSSPIPCLHFKTAAGKRECRAFSSIFTQRLVGSKGSRATMFRIMMMITCKHIPLGDLERPNTGGCQKMTFWRPTARTPSLSLWLSHLPARACGLMYLHRSFFKCPARGVFALSCILPLICHHTTSEAETSWFS